jgi:N,N-dimethylformamidase
MASVMGYANRRSVRIGESIAFKVSCDGFPRYRASIVRLLSAETFPEPHAPPFRFDDMRSAVDGEYEGRRFDIPAGSYAEIPASPILADLSRTTLAAFVWPTLLGKGEQAILGAVDIAGAGGIGLHIDRSGCLTAVIGGDGGRKAALSLPRPLAARRWTFVAVAVDGASGAVLLYQRQVEPHQFDAGDEADRTWSGLAAAMPANRPFRLAAAGEAGRVCLHYNGKLQRPRVFGQPLKLAELQALAISGPATAADPRALADWDFSRDIGSEKVTDLSRNALHGRTVNLPTRGVTGVNWTAERHDWRAVPEEYGAIHFHEDDIYDASWPTAFTLTVPESWQSGTYACRLQAGDEQFWVPFFVRPKAGRPTARCAFLVPTCTYAAYANFRSRVEGRFNELYHGRLTVLDRTDFLMEEYMQLGSSTYDPHSDGSLTVYSSMLRPVTNFRPTGRVYKFCQDMFIVAWLEQTGIPYDIVTDDDLHAEGVSAIADYACVMTGSHPEYYSTEMLDALEAFLRRGGRLMYLGGNGFYWRTAYHPTLAGVVEVRRAGQGFLASNAEAESHMSFTGEVAGLWQRVGRPPNLICGVGMVTQGFDRCEGYRRTAASRDPRAAFVFRGVDDDVVGDFGVLQGGAAGYEIDRYDATLGSPRHALVLASSFNHTNIYDVSVPSFTDLIPKANEQAPDPIRADMVFFETPCGGAVFSTGSIAWCGSLSYNRYANNVERITRNVLERFIDPTPFTMPKGGTS